MRKAGHADDCSACSSALAAADALAAAAVDQLPLPGEVELIVGGPPCQVRHTVLRSDCVLCQTIQCMCHMLH
jgi:hypothetical protein